MKNTYRFFVDPEALTGETVELADRELAHQLGRVLRLHAGDEVVLLDGAGEAYTVELTAITKQAISGRVVARAQANGEPQMSLTLYLALIRPERFEWALQKAVELGVGRIVPTQFARSLGEGRADERRLERWVRIVREAAEQSCRGRLPEVAAPLSFAAASAEALAAGPALLLDESEALPLRSVLAQFEMPPTHLAIFSGPEGGISPAERSAASEHGMMAVSLGPRILRAETAPLVAAAAIFYQFGDV